MTCSREITPMQRVLTTLSHQEPDRVPFFLLNNLHGARLLEVSIEDYFQRPDWVAEGQIRLQERYQDDCYYTFFYAALEVEAFGGEVLFFEDGPPNGGTPVIQQAKQIDSLEAPRIEDSPPLARVLDATRRMHQHAGDRIPLIGVVMSPFSLPVMQMGFEAYLELIYNDPKRFERLMQINEDFCVRWANAQLSAGATAICYFDPMSSPSMIPADLYRKTGFPIARRTLARIEGATATHFASTRLLPIADDLRHIGTQVVGVGHEERMVDAKRALGEEITLLGNLNGIEMVSWTDEMIAEQVKRALQAAPGGGLILGDNHGELPWQVPDSVLMSLSSGIRQMGRYPIAEAFLHE